MPLRVTSALFPYTTLFRSGPDFRSPQEARAYLLTLKQVLEYAGASDCDMEKGSLRVDANVSVHRAGETALGTKVEVKNINSFAYVEKPLTRSEEHTSELQSHCDLVWRLLLEKKK